MEGTGGAGSGEAVAVDDVGFAGDMGGLGHFRKRRAMFGVGRATIALQQAGAAEEPGAVPQPGEADTLLGGGAQQVDEIVVGLEFGAQATADHQQLQRLQRRDIKARVGADHQAQVTDDFALVAAKSARGKQFRAQQVGGDEGVEGLGKCRQREVFQQQEADAGDRRRLLGGIIEVAQVLAFHTAAELTSFHRGLAHCYC